MLHAIANTLYSTDPEKTASFLAGALNFNIKPEHYYWLADNGSVSFRIEKSMRAENPPIHVHSSNFMDDIQNLLNRDDITPLSEIECVNHIVTQLLGCDCGIKLLVFYEYDEDERDELIPLPTTLVWDEETITKTQRILRITPIPFRENARRKATETAELKAINQGLLVVSEADAMQALAEVTPAFQHQALFAAMENEGIKADLYLNSNTWLTETSHHD